MVPAPAGIAEDALLNAIAFFSQVIGATAILAEAVSHTVIVCVAESLQPAAVDEYKYLIVFVLPGTTDDGVNTPVADTPGPL
jgi:hypothetical protein